VDTVSLNWLAIDSIERVERLTKLLNTQCPVDPALLFANNIFENVYEMRVLDECG
jgi:hypothetical protein